jgi:bacteriocin biosynthesis cyclodehydratase domain-containing protein
VKPRLAPYVYLVVEAGKHGEDTLFVNSSARQITFRGDCVRALLAKLIPLLDGSHTIDEIRSITAESISSADCTQFLGELARHNLINDHSTTASIVSPQTVPGLDSQLGLLNEYFLDGQQAQRQICNSTVTIFGLSGAGAFAATALAEARLGRLRLVDPLPVDDIDCYLSPFFSRSDRGEKRADTLRRTITQFDTAIEVCDVDFSSEGIAHALDITDFVIVCYEVGAEALLEWVNRACLDLSIPWTSCATNGMEARIGPTVYPGRSPCYSCFLSRISAASRPEEERHSRLRGKGAPGPAKENSIFAAGLLGHSVAWEAVKALTQVHSPATLGSIIIMDMLSMSTTKHVILRKPWCAACSASRTGL